ncbi:EAL domain-containing protein [Nocardioides sp.]|uniref:sensor domain-containing protein n=1 Tax=Nocardioides sp. TaxID=35761 RepID=UPI0035615A4B
MYDAGALSRALDLVPEGMCIWTFEDLADPASLVLEYGNLAGLEVAGFSPEMVGRRVQELLPSLFEAGLVDVVRGVVDAGAGLDLGEMEFGDDRIERSLFRVGIHPLSERQVLVKFERVGPLADGGREPPAPVLNDALIVLDESGVIREWSAAAQALYGISENLARGAPFGSLVRADDRKALETAFALVRSEVRECRVESRQIAADGSLLVVVMILSPRRDEAGAVAGISVVVRDLTQSVRLQESLDLVLGTVGLGLWDLDLATGRMTNSATFDALFGREQQVEDWTIETWRACVHPEDVGLFDVELARMSSSAELDHTAEFRIVRPDGAVRWLDSRGHVGRDAHDRPVHVSGVTWDVTSAREVELRAQRLAGQLAGVVDCLGDAVIGTTPDGSVTSWNPAAEKLLGWSEEEAVGQRLEAMTRADQEGPGGRLREIVLRGETVNNVPAELRRKDGVRVEVERTASPLREGGDVVGIIEVLRDVTERRSMERALRHEVLHDSLTALPNRVLINDRIQHALAVSKRNGRPVSVLMLDLDNFKYVNDAAGHAEGDRLIVDLAQRLAARLRPGDTVGRFGGDEFVLVCEETDADQARVVAERLHETLREPFTLGDREVIVTASVGIVTTPPYDAEALVRSADIAMYHAKAAGRARSSAFGPSMAAHARAQHELSQELRRAIETDELAVHYQPVVDLASGELLGLEGLVRWRHPERGDIRPDQFVPLAEEMGQIEALDRWVLRQVCADGAQMMARGLLSPSSRIAVNVGAQHISSGGVVGSVAAAFESGTGDFGFSQLTVEVTETAVMDDLETARRSLEDLSALGVSIALDDFGTGYSSLTHLQRLPISVLKIDRSFVRRMPLRAEDVAVASSIVELAAAVGIGSVIAEGIETAEQLGMLQAMHCSAGQGWLWSRAVALEDVADLMGSLPQRRFPVAGDLPPT